MENIIDCNENCFLCEKKQVWKVNFAGFHGLCSYHKESTEELMNYICIHCESIICTYKFSCVECDYCYENPKNYVLGCNHNICEICYNEANSCCPLCLFNPLQVEIKESLTEEALIEQPKYQINIEENEVTSDGSIESEVIEDEDELYVIEEVELSLEASMAFDTRISTQSTVFDITKSIQSTSADSNSQTIKSIENIPLQNPQQTYIYKKCPKCASGILVELDTYKEVYKCSSCDNFFCIFCLELLKHPSSKHHCAGTTKKLVIMPRKEFNKKNKKLKKIGSMLQVCPFCKDMREYRIEKGYYICCENPMKCELMFCLLCGDAINELDGEEFINHFINGSNNPCVKGEEFKKIKTPVIYQYDRLKIYKS